MPDRRTEPAKRALAGLFLLWAGTSAASAQTAPDCAGRLDISETTEVISLRLSAPCAPYAPVAIAMGDLRFTEETGIDGGLELDLPRLAGKGHLAVSTASQTIVAPLSSTDGLTDYVVATATPAAWPVQMAQGAAEAVVLGYPTATPRALVLPLAGPEALQLDLPVTADTCGTETTLTLRHGSSEAASTVSVKMPDCSRLGSTLRLQMDPPR